MPESENQPAAPADFIREIVAEDLRGGKHTEIHTRFPPEPNGYLHIGHAKAICLGFGIAREFDGLCNVRMDDTNPAKEESEYVDSILADVRWLISGWADDKLALKPAGATPEQAGSDFIQSAVRTSPSAIPTEPFYASDYFGAIYEFAVRLVRKGAAYVDDMTPEQTDEYRRIGKESPFRDRAIEENLDLLARMKA